jgi:hypothetical protein
MKKVENRGNNKRKRGGMGRIKKKKKEERGKERGRERRKEK